MIRMLLALIGYAATATVITLALGAGYLWHTDRLTDDKTFRIIAILQGIDLQQLAETRRKSAEETPAEEPSMEARLAQQQVLDRNFEVKLLALQRGRQEYDHRLEQLKEQTERYDRLAKDWEDKFKQEEQLATQENMAKVVNDLEQVKPAIAKDLLMRWIQEDRMSAVITLLGKMSETKKAKILKSFTTPDELDKLHEIHRLLLESTDTEDKVNQALGDLQSLSQAKP